MLAPSLSRGQLLKKTGSRCPVCLQACPAKVWRTDETPARVFLTRVCPEHGEHQSCIASDARFYWTSQGAGTPCCASARLSPATSTFRFERLSTCLALIEIVRSCNLSCPTCYADSPLGRGETVDAVPLNDVQRRIQGVIDRKGSIEILQLSGGEPSLHPQLIELLEWAKAHDKIDYLLLNTNGVRLAHEPEFAARLGQLFPKGGLQIYLQFDGVQAEGQRWLRGADLRAVRQRALDHCAAANLPVTLAMTVTPQNLPHVWDAISFGLGLPHIHGITFQPMFQSGRVVGGASVVSGGAPPFDSGRLNTADIILAAVEQSDGCLRCEDFTPLPCGDPNCATVGYLIRAGGRAESISHYIDLSKLQGFLHNRLQYTMEDLSRCGCESEPLGALLKQLELRSSMAFRIMIKPFMDASSWDEHRIQRCCTHVIRPDGRLDSFCRYYSGFADCRDAPA
jgi:uncharacterized radical SAM superfamily Fe-S cluster-containing enzyme